MRDCSKNHRYLTYVEQDNQFYSMPLSYDDIDLMPDKDLINKELKELDTSKTPKNLEEFWQFSIGNTLQLKETLLRKEEETLLIVLTFILLIQLPKMVTTHTLILLLEMQKCF